MTYKVDDIYCKARQVEQQLQALTIWLFGSHVGESNIRERPNQAIFLFPRYRCLPRVSSQPEVPQAYDVNLSN